MSTFFFFFVGEMNISKDLDRKLQMRLHFPDKMVMFSLV